MAYPTIEELTAKLAEYVDSSGSTASDDEYVADCTQEAVDWLEHRLADAGTPVPPLPPVPLLIPNSVYTRVVLDVGAQLFRRRRQWTVTDPLDGPQLPPVRNDPYSVAYPVLAPYLPAVIA